MKPRPKNIFLIAAAAVLMVAVCFLFKDKFVSCLSFWDRISPPDRSYAQVLLAGDMMFDRHIRGFADKNGGYQFILEKISPTLKDSDLVVANLEGPITDNKSISISAASGDADEFYFTFDPSVAKVLSANNIRIVDLGNNHILNFGRDGLASTKKYLDEAHVGYFGAPDYPKSTSEQIGGVRITFVSYNEFADLPESIEQKSTVEEIQKAKGFSDIIIVFCHWGDEYTAIPTDAQRSLAHQFLDAGADLLVGSHSHVIGETEVYKNKRIYYSLGNFVFDQYFNEKVRNGLGVILKIDKKTKQLDFSEQKFYLDQNGQTVEK